MSFKHIIVPSKAAPKGYTCSKCKKKLRAGQHALYSKFTIAIDMKSNHVITKAWHSECAKEVLDTEPEHLEESDKLDQYVLNFDRIKKSIADANQRV